MVEVPSFAKLNLGLYIKEKRKDNYHNLESIFQTISLCDYLYITPAENKTVVKSNSPLVPENSSNLAYQAVILFKEATGIDKNWNIRIKKNIPVGAGLGGGSSNAAATLLTINRLCDFPLEEKNLIKIALKIGSDVPFFIKGGTAIVTGRGEKIKRPGEIPPLYFILAIPSFRISTAEAYRKLDTKENNKSLTKTDLSTILKQLLRSKKYVLSDLKNSFENFLVDEYPRLKDIKDMMFEYKPINVLLSGSGPTLYAVFGSKKERDSVKEMLKVDFLTLYCRSISRHEYYKSLNLKEE